MLDPETTDMFHFSGPKYTTPKFPVDMAPISIRQAGRRATQEVQNTVPGILSTEFRFFLIGRDPYMKNGVSTRMKRDLDITPR